MVVRVPPLFCAYEPLAGFEEGGCGWDWIAEALVEGAREALQNGAEQEEVESATWNLAYELPFPAAVSANLPFLPLRTPAALAVMLSQVNP